MDITEYRLKVFDRPRGGWQVSYGAAQDDAIALGLAYWDSARREWFLVDPVFVETRTVPAPVPRSLRRRGV